MLLFNFLPSLATLILPLVLGYALQPLASGRLIPGFTFAARAFAARVKVANITVFTPITLMLSFWAVQISSFRLLALPALGAGALVIGGSLALIAARMLNLNRPQTGSLFVCGMFTNLGSIGGQFSYLIWGEAGFALVSLYRLLEQAIYFVVGWPVSNYYGSQGALEVATSSPASRVAEGLAVARPSVAVLLWETFRKPVTILPLAGMGIGMLLQFFDIARPPVLSQVNGALILGGTMLLLFAVGLDIRPGKVRDHIRPCAVVCAIKFIAIPVAVALGAYMLGLHRIDGGLPFRVALLLSAMPVAFNALVPPAIFGLDEDLANSCWLVSVAALGIVVPVFYVVLT